MKHPEIKLTGCQIKSVEKARMLAKHLDVVEKEFGIRATEIALEDCFVCPDITDEELDSLNRTAMERAVRECIRRLRARPPV